MNAAFGDPTVRAVLATTGGEDQITVIRHLVPDVVLGEGRSSLADVLLARMATGRTEKAPSVPVLDVSAVAVPTNGHVKG